VLEFRKRISWYSKTMAPCRPMKDPMRLMNSAADFERILSTFLEWRLQRDEAVRAGKIAPIDDELEAVDSAA
jgi:hypothetical protein